MASVTHNFMQVNGVDFSKDGEQLDATAGEPLSSLKILVQIPGESSIPKGLMISLLSKGRNMTGFQRLDAKGEAKIDEVPAGRYELVAWGARRPYSIARATAEGAEVTGHSIILTPGASATASITLVQGSVEVEGSVKKAGKGFAGAMGSIAPVGPPLHSIYFLPFLMWYCPDLWYEACASGVLQSE